MVTKTQKFTFSATLVRSNSNTSSISEIRFLLLNTVRENDDFYGMNLRVIALEAEMVTELKI